MMNKIWGLMIILCCCFVSVAFGQETNFTLAAPDSPVLVQTKVDVSIEKNGILTFNDYSQLLGKITLKVVEKVTLLSGDYKGWGYALIQYNAGNLNGSIYYVFQNDEGRGMLSGDIIGVTDQQDGLESDMIWKVAILEGADTHFTIDLVFDNYKPGKETLHENIWMPVLPDFKLSTNGYHQETTVLLLPAPDGNIHHSRKYKGGGLEFGTYQVGTQSGTIWSFIDNSEIADPFSHKRYGTRDGILEGSFEVEFQQGSEGNSAESWSTLLAD